MMPRKTVLAIARAHVSTTPALARYLNLFRDRPDAWFARSDGDVFLGEIGELLNKQFSSHLQKFFSTYLREIGIDGDGMMSVEITDSRRGSWVMEAALTMFGSIGTAYTMLKGASELPKIADGIEESKERLQKELHDLLSQTVRERIEPYFDKESSSLPETTEKLKSVALNDPIDVGFFIDARPLRSLTPDVIKTHAIHLSVGLFRAGLSVENLSESKIDNLRIGLFKSIVEVKSWYFGDAYIKMIPVLGSKQTISLAVQEFVKYNTALRLDLSDNSPLYVDCWIQDNNGIYLFNFLLE